jgi:glycosyltransferase involved in cell wall biosynthesis
MGKLNILFVIDHLGGGGAELQLVEIMNNLNRRDFQISLFLTEGGGVRQNKLKEDIAIFGVHGERKRKPLRTILNLRKLVKKISPDLIVSWLEYSTFITVLAISCLKLRHYAGVWGNLEYIYTKEVKLGLIKKFLLRLAYQRVDKIIFNSYNVAEKNDWIKNKNKVVIYNVFDVEKIRRMQGKVELRRILNLKNDYFYIVFVGSLVSRKGVNLLIESFIKVANPKLKLLIVGTGPLEENLKKISANDERIEFLGYRENAIEYIKASDLLILPSFSEGIPNVIIEALACETPVIATDVDGIPEIIKHKKSGLLIKPCSVEEIKKSIEYAVINYQEMISFAQEGRKIVEKFKRETIIFQFEELFRNSQQK